MSQQENILTERLSKELTSDVPKSNAGTHIISPIDAPLSSLETSDIFVEESAPLNTSSYRNILGFLITTFLANVWGKYLMESCGITPFEIIYATGVVSVILSLIYLKLNDIYLFSVETDKSGMVLAGSLAGFLGLSGFFVSLYLLNIADAFAFDCLSVIAALVVDYIWFKGTLRFYQLLGFICAFLGVIFLVKPSYLFDESVDPLKRRLFSGGIVAGLIGAIFSGIYGGVLRRTCAKVNLMVSFTFLQFAMSLFSPCMVLIHFEIRGKPTTYTFGSLISLIMVGALGWVAQWCLATSLKEEKIVSRVYPFKYLLVIAGIVIDLIGLNLTMSSFLGILLLGANFVVAVYYLFYARA